mmetsp:Transcript_83092/g.253967  ORF Transcript_83092/g.253967 Transcript_83092/m.253967 type:complete len:358 (-) Transcript_83092:61-1134(-)
MTVPRSCCPTSKSLACLNGTNFCARLTSGLNAASSVPSAQATAKAPSPRSASRTPSRQRLDPAARGATIASPAWKGASASTSAGFFRTWPGPTSLSSPSDIQTIAYLALPKYFSTWASCHSRCLASHKACTFSPTAKAALAFSSASASGCTRRSIRSVLLPPNFKPSSLHRAFKSWALNSASLRRSAKTLALPSVSKRLPAHWSRKYCRSPLATAAFMASIWEGASTGLSADLRVGREDVAASPRKRLTSSSLVPLIGKPFSLHRCWSSTFLSRMRAALVSACGASAASVDSASWASSSSTAFLASPAGSRAAASSGSSSLLASSASWSSVALEAFSTSSNSLGSMPDNTAAGGPCC